MKNTWKVSVGIATIAVGGLTGCSGEQITPRPTSSNAAVPSRDSGSNAPSDDEGRTVANYFKVGDCFKDPVTAAASVMLVDCDELHSGEVYAIFPLPDGPFPGNDDSGEFKKKCGGFARANFPPQLGNDPTLRTVVRFPDERSWAIGDRSVTWIAASDPPRTGSIRDAKS